ncbi:G2 and S phase-expressed protein 1 isoform X2 [Clinocottus analis]|uniref:G2 and S phase-expressed protein 1 isoform X2 n=1 Tax=Clinocottus analis TaxID=304258 RepID=UPI0035BEFAA2
MDCGAKSGLLLFTDEKFDFDVSLSPASCNGDGDEDEDEVFMGPVSHKERCASVSVASRAEGGGVRASWSPLSGDQLEEVCQEAHRLADRLQCSELSQPRGEDAATTAVASDVFVRGVEAKLGELCQPAGALSPIKRQTFCVQDSPMKQLPPAVQRRLLRGNAAGTPTSTRPAAKATTTRLSTTSTRLSTTSTRLSITTTRLSTTTTRLSTTSTRLAAPVAASPAAIRSTSSPVAGVRPLLRTGLRARTALGVAAVLPSKPAAAATTSAGRSAAEKPRMQPPPSRPLAGWRRSPSGSSRAGSCEDLLSDSASVASDVSDSSINSSLLGKRSLAPPTKRALVNPSGVKAPPLQRRRMTESKNTSSSSSSVSSFNSSLSLSPATGKLNSSQSSSTGPAPASRPANQSRPRRSTAAAEPPASSSAAAGRRSSSLSTQARKLSEAERVKAARSTPLKRAEATPLQQTPAKRVLERTASIPAAASTRPHSGLKTKSKPEPSVAPTPSGRVRGVAPDVSTQKRLASVSGVDGLPQTPSAGGCRSLQAKTRRPSALPTPVRRRVSSIPVATPSRPPPTFDFGHAPPSARSERRCSPAPADTQEAEPVDVRPFCLEEAEPVDVRPFCLEEAEPVDVQPFCLEEAEPVDVQPVCLEEAELPAAPPPTSASQTDQSESTDPGAPCCGESEPSKNLIELETTEEKNKMQEVLLLDLPAPTLRPQEKLLIDLTNTPDLIRTTGKTCAGTQLIDLSSPLIRWSPEEKRQNNAPLINLSF